MAKLYRLIPPMQFATRHILWGTLIIAIVFQGWNIWRPNSRSYFINSYAQTAAAAMVVDFMEQNGGEWPSNWPELWATQYRHDLSGERIFNSIDEIEPFVIVDFSFDPDAARRKIGSGDTFPKFRVIKSRKGWTGGFESGDPNQIVFDYLKNRSEADK